MASPLIPELAKPLNGVSATRLVLVLNAPILLVLGWMTIVIINQGSTIAVLEEKIKVIKEHAARPWHDDAGIQLSETKGEVGRLKEDVKEIRLHHYGAGNNIQHNLKEELK